MMALCRKIDFLLASLRHVATKHEKRISRLLRPLCLRRPYADEEEATRNSIAKDGYAITAKLESHVFVDVEKQQVYTVYYRGWINSSKRVSSCASG